MLGVSKEESDAIMEGIITDSASSSAETEDEPTVSSETTVSTEKVKKTKKKEKPAEPLEPTEETTEGEPEEEPETPSEPLVKPVSQKKSKKSKKVTKTVIPLTKILPPGIDEADTDGDGTVSVEEAKEEV